MSARALRFSIVCSDPYLLMALLLLRLPYMGKVMKLNFHVFSDLFRASVTDLADTVACPYLLH